MTKKCFFCNTSTARPKYCSDVCNKRAYHTRNSKGFLYGVHNKFWETETGIGLIWEKYVANLLNAKHLLFNLKGADIDWNGKMVDVKSAHLNFRKNKRGKPVKGQQKGYWGFKNAGKGKIDFLFCVGLDSNNNPAKLLLIPKSEYPKIGITVGWKSKYDKYIYKPPSA